MDTSKQLHIDTDVLEDDKIAMSPNDADRVARAAGGITWTGAVWLVAAALILAVACLVSKMLSV